jgi:hypothetical protein
MKADATSRNTSFSVSSFQFGDSNTNYKLGSTIRFFSLNKTVSKFYNNDLGGRK